MGRPKCAADGGLIYPVLNCAMRMTIFEKAEDFAALERGLDEADENKRCRTRFPAHGTAVNPWIRLPRMPARARVPGRRRYVVMVSQQCAPSRVEDLRAAPRCHTRELFNSQGRP